MNAENRYDSRRSPLAELARVIASCGKRGVTPVIKCDASITLRDEFYVALCQAVRAESGCDVRLDLLPDHRLAGNLRLLRRQSHIRRLNRRLEGTASATPTIALSRSRISPSEIIIGLAGPKDELPPYAKAIELAA